MRVSNQTKKDRAWGKVVSCINDNGNVKMIAAFKRLLAWSAPFLTPYKGFNSSQMLTFNF